MAASTVSYAAADGRARVDRTFRSQFFPALPPFESHLLPTGATGVYKIGAAGVKPLGPGANFAF